MDKDTPVQKNLRQMKQADDALDQSVALNRITMQLLQDRAKEAKRLWVALLAALLAVALTVGGILYFLANYDITVTTTTTETTYDVDQNAGEGGRDNVFQTGENAAYYAGGDS